MWSRIVFVVLFISLPVSPSWALDPRSGPMFHQAMQEFCQFPIINKNGDPKGGEGVIVYGVNGCTVVAVIQRDCIVRVSVNANRQFPRGLTVRPIHMAFAMLAVSSGGNPAAQTVQEQFQQVWDKIVFRWGNGGRGSFNTGHYGIKIETLTTENDEAVKIYLR